MVVATERPVQTAAKPSAPSAPLAPSYDDDPKPRLFTEAERRAMLDAGILADDERAVSVAGRIMTRDERGKFRPRPFTRKEYHAMAKAEILGHWERVQLIEGEILVMSPVGSRHFGGVNLLTKEYSTSGRLAGLATVSVQNPLAVWERSEPEPDFQLLVYREDGYARGAPRPEDVLLAVEVSDSTLNHDVNEKLPMYAAAGVPETWIMNLREDVIDSHSDPSPDGYRTTRRYRIGDAIAPLAFPDLEVEVARLIPER